uniref:Fork-head domain-containing protein n=1 Tax=Heterorhabditis bacteriophora TaxID=37862 RepID=A0A1I7WV83_HETBA
MPLAACHSAFTFSFTPNEILWQIYRYKRVLSVQKAKTVTGNAKETCEGSNWSITAEYRTMVRCDSIDNTGFPLSSLRRSKKCAGASDEEQCKSPNVDKGSKSSKKQGSRYRN